MQLSGRFLRMYRLCGGGGVAGGGPKPQMGVPFPHCPPSALYHQLGHAPVHRAPPQTRKKTWSFIQDLSYDTFFTMKRLLERSQRPDEVLRWISQNPSKVSQSHLAVALQRIAQLLPAPPPAVEAPPSCAETTPTASEAPPPVSEGGGAKGRKQTLEHQDFLSLCDTIVRDCGKFDNFSLVTSLYAAATLGLSPDSSLVMALESECERRVSQFNQKDLSMVFSSVMRLHHRPHPHLQQAHLSQPHPPPHLPLDPQQQSAQHPSEPQTEACAAAEQGPEAPPPVQREAPPPGVALTEACLSGLERSLERERHPQTLFLLLAYYRGRWRELHSQSEHSNKDTSTAGANPELLLTNRKILRVVKHTLSCVSTVRDQEMALLDEMLAACAAEASNRSLELIFSSHLFHQSRQERFITRLAEELPKKADSLSPNTMALIAKYAARHRLRETRLLDTVAEYLLKRAEQLDTKVIQRLVFPLSRMNYRPQNALELFERLEQVLEPKALSSPLATVNILMSLLQLRYCPPSLLREVFCPGFIHSLTNSPYLGIVRRYLSLLDSAVDLEFEEYSGPRLNPAHKVLMFDHALTADEVNRKYSYKGLVAEALRQLIGEQSYKQDQILPPGYYTDFLLWIDSSRRVVPIRSVKPCDPSAWQLDSSGLIPDFQKFSLEAEPSEDALPVVGGTCLHHMTPFYSADYYPAPSKDQEIHRVVLSVNDKWHYCHNSQVLVGSRAMRDRHLRLLGYLLLQLPYHELEKLNGIEEVKGYLQQKLTDLPLTGPHLPL
ncbi:fas-activated serine/threonine kinase [Periophthalmus magnuspinnatus]|uniref:fas-activated serine/threonine kinase n=1 Tax=Periophthalmus magnuspinnatus TaxID=409849 RepID=UPI002437411D|nr:fas-activated serine/threonine kinase [Periophthalmus magnuspinnatus]XP_055084747.1 fas-activated serine/threonine kinase [Periophthalmus magnuspinnatus]